MKAAPVTALQRALLALLLAACALPSTAAFAAAPKPLAKPSVAEREAERQRSAAVREAVRLQSRIEDEREVISSLDQRIDAMDLRLFTQKTRWSDARADLRAARSRYTRRMVSMYKTGGLDPVQLLVGSSSFRDLLRRSAMITEMAKADREAVVKARRAEAEAAYLSSVMSEMQEQLVVMRASRKSRLQRVQTDLDTQRRIIARLDGTGRKHAYTAIRTHSKARTAKRNEWKRSSLPIGSSVWLAKATVVPYKNDYIVPSHQPREYRATGSRFTAVCSWYGNEFHGRRTASGQIFNQNDLTCASRTLPFGTRLALTRGGKRIVVVVNDRGPFIHGRDLDLSRAAARLLGISGVGSVTAEKVAVVR